MAAAFDIGLRVRALPALGPTLLILALARPAAATTYAATPADYKAKLAMLKAGDRLELAAGTYATGLDVTKLAGTEAAPIVITGPVAEPAGDPTAVFEGRACCNTVEITDSSYVVVRGLRVDSKGIDGVFGVSVKGASVSHHITIDGCLFVGQDGSQQTVAISTHAATWGWVIRGNKIVGAGTGMYLGLSDGSAPFIGGIVESNLVENTIGYNVQIKHQNPWPAVPGIPAGPNRTQIRNNVFIKNDGPSPDGDRPNLLVDGQPASGPGSSDVIEIYGNLLFHNPRESLLQASGRVSIHDNLFVDASDMALNLRDHNLPLVRAHVYNNTIYAAKRGIVFGNAADEDAVVGNLVFAASGSGIVGTIANKKDNIEDSVMGAMLYLSKASIVLGTMDLYPAGIAASGSALDLSPFAGDVAWKYDFNGDDRGTQIWRGAYAGKAPNPGWKPTDGFKTGGFMGGGSGGGDGGASDGGATDGAPGDAAGDGSSANDGGTTDGNRDATRDSANDASGAGGGGCGCRVGRAGRDSATAVMLAFSAVVVIRRRKSRSSSTRTPAWVR